MTIFDTQEGNQKQPTLVAAFSRLVPHNSASSKGNRFNALLIQLVCKEGPNDYTLIYYCTVCVLSLYCIVYCYHLLCLPLSELLYKKWTNDMCCRLTSWCLTSWYQTTMRKRRHNWRQGWRE